MISILKSAIKKICNLQSAICNISGTTWCLIIILAIAGFLRFYDLPNLPPGLYPDEAMNGNNALEAIKTGTFKLFYPENNGREGLFINIQAFFLWLVGKNEPWVLRLPSAIFGVLTALGVFLLTRELWTPGVPPLNQNSNGQQFPREDSESPNIKKFGILSSNSIALLSSFLLATSFWHINFSRIGFRAISAPFFLTWGIYLLLRSFNNSAISHPEVPKEPKDLSRFFATLRITYLPTLAGLIYGAGFHTYIAYRATPLIFLPIFWHYRKAEHFKKIAVIFSLATFLAFLPLGYYFLKNPHDFFGRTTQVSIFKSDSPIINLGKNILKTFGAFNFVGDYNWRHNYSGRPLLFWPVGIIFIIGLAKVILSTAKNLKRFFVNPRLTQNYNTHCHILILWLLTASLPVIVSNEGLPHALRMILMVPPVFIFAGYGGIVFYEFIKTRSKGAFLVPTTAIFLSLLIFESYHAYFIAWGKNQNTKDAFAHDYVDLASSINKLPEYIPKYIVVQANGVLVRELPTPTQTVMFLTDSFRLEEQKAKNIHYVLPENSKSIPKNATIFYIK